MAKPMAIPCHSFLLAGTTLIPNSLIGFLKKRAISLAKTAGDLKNLSPGFKLARPKLISNRHRKQSPMPSLDQILEMINEASIPRSRPSFVGVRCAAVILRTYLQRCDSGRGEGDELGNMYSCVTSLSLQAP